MLRDEDMGHYIAFFLVKSKRIKANILPSRLKRTVSKTLLRQPYSSFHQQEKKICSRYVLTKDRLTDFFLIFFFFFLHFFFLFKIDYN